MALGMMFLVATGLARYGSHQDPRLDLQFAIPASGLQTPVLDVRPAPPLGQAVVGDDFVEYPIFAMQTPSDAKKVTAHFSSATAKEVFDWFETQGLSFVVDDSQIPAGARVTLNVVDQPVDVVADALAQALGGHWTMRNGIRVFRKGPASNMGAFTFSPDDLPKSMQVFGGKGGPKFFNWTDGSSQSVQDEAKKIEDQAKAFQKEFGPAFQQDLKEKIQAQDWQKQLGSDFQQKLQDDMKGSFGPDWQQKLQAGTQGQFGPDFQQKLQDEIKGQFSPDFQLKLQKDVQGQFGPEFEKRIEKMAQDLAKSAEELSREIQRQENSGQFKSSSDWSRLFQDRQDAMPKVVDAKKFLSTLTPGQKDIAKTRGYLRFSDLTDDQRRMLGGTPGGHTILKFKTDGQQIEIRDK